MNNYSSFKSRDRNRILLIVEGDHEKNTLFELILKCFPQININIDDVIIYGTNIYMLFNDIVIEYGDSWYDEMVDLPLIVTKKINPGNKMYKNQFTNIFIVFDYERHDPQYSEEKIKKMQEYFIDATEMGVLYINYPMIESYVHLNVLPDKDYLDRNICVTLQPGKKNKALVTKESVIQELINIPDKIDEILYYKYGLSTAKDRNMCTDEILGISKLENLDKKVEEILSKYLSGSSLNTAKFHILHILKSLGYLNDDQSYYSHLKYIFKQIIIHNILKAYKIQTGSLVEFGDDIISMFRDLSLIRILDNQNNFSHDNSSGIIYILNTCILLVPDYNINFIK